MSIYSYVWGWRDIGIRKGDLVLKVGSGGRPLARSDVLCDKFLEDSCERAEGPVRFPIVADRPIVCADAQMLPFRDASFDFVVAIHTLEHLERPEAFLEEAMRVARRGYFVTPSRVCELLTPRRTHLWLVEVESNGKLTLRQKEEADPWGVGASFHLAWQHDRNFRRFFFSRPDIFEVRFSYEGRAEYLIERQGEIPEWFTKATLGMPDVQQPNLTFRQQVARIMRRVFSSAVRAYHSPRFDLWSLLVCPLCHGELDHRGQHSLVCESCSHEYIVRPDGIPVFLVSGASERCVGS